MRTLGHAEANEQLMDLVLDPAALRHFGSGIQDRSRPGDPIIQARSRADGPAPRSSAARGGPAFADESLRAHLQTCPICRDTLASWQRTHDAVQAALDGSTGPAASELPGARAPLSLRELTRDEPFVALEADAQRLDADGELVPLRAPAGLRSAILVGVRARPTVPPSDPVGYAHRRPTLRADAVRRRLIRRYLPLVAVLAVGVVGAGMLLAQSSRLDQVQRETAALENVTATVERVLQDPGHRVVLLTDAGGGTAGSVAWSSRDFVVLASALEPPASGLVYRCWIERNGIRSPVGQMEFAGGTAFWSGSLDSWATISFDAGTFGVSLEPVTGSVGNPPVLAGRLGG